MIGNGIKMSESENETEIVNSLRILLSYVNELGVNVNRIYDRLEKIETDVNNIRTELTEAVSNTQKDLADTKKSMITKPEFREVLKKLNQPFEKFTPPKTTERQRKQRSSTQPEKAQSEAE